MQPYSIIGSPFEVYVSATGVAFPKVHVPPTIDEVTGWTLLGVNGVRSQDEDGVTVSHDRPSTSSAPPAPPGP